MDDKEWYLCAAMKELVVYGPSSLPGGVTVELGGATLSPLSQSAGSLSPRSEIAGSQVSIGVETLSKQSRPSIASNAARSGRSSSRLA